MLVRTLITLYVCSGLAGARVREVSIPHSHQRIQTSGESTILRSQRLEYTAPLAIIAGEKMHGYVTPILVSYSLSHMFTRFYLLVTKYKLVSSCHM